MVFFYSSVDTVSDHHKNNFIDFLKYCSYKSKLHVYSGAGLEISKGGSRHPIAKILHEFTKFSKTEGDSNPRNLANRSTSGGWLSWYSKITQFMSLLVRDCSTYIQKENSLNQT